MNSVNVAVKNCARCGGEHEAILFLPFSGQVNPHYSHWAECPKTGHPVLMNVEEKSDSPENKGNPL